MRTMTHLIIPTSQELVRQTRAAWGLTKEQFAERLGTSGQHAGRIELGQQVFGDNFITPGCTHPDPAVRTFWQEYKTARQHEQDVAIIENCFENLGG